jgi:hypothetical protein
LNDLSVLSNQLSSTPGLYWISNFDSLHASPMVAVRETVPRRAVSYREVVNSKLLTIIISDWPSRPLSQMMRCSASVSSCCSFGADEINGHKVLRSSGTSPNFLITLASLKSPLAGSPVRLKATAPT